MPRTAHRYVGLCALILVVLLCTDGSLSGQSSSVGFVATTKNGEWQSYTGDTRGWRYSPLDQINARNFNDLEVAWRFKTDSLGTRPEYKLEGTPLMVGGTLYATAGTRRAVIALDAATGELLWVHRYPEATRGANAPRQLSGRGLAYWTDGRGDHRILYVTPGYRLIALNAKTGQPITSFGTNGVVDLKVGVVYGDGKPIDLETGEIGLHSTPTIVHDVVLVGSAMKEGMTVTTHNNTKGLARAFDVRTGKLKWTFNTIPKPNEPGGDTWLNNSWAINGNTGVWTQITVDEELGLVYLPVESPTSDYYGAKRPGNNLYGESLVCVDISTGKPKWYFQFVHHPIWDHDMSSAPLLADVTIDGKPRKVVAVPSKQAWLYVFDRVTGEPIWPIEEKPVPKGDVPGEWYAPTQPHPPASLMYGRNALNDDDLIDFTPELRAQAKKNLERYKWYPGVVYNPPIVGNVNGLLGAINMGNANGGTNWPGGGYDPDTHTVFAQAATASIAAESVAPPPRRASPISSIRPASSGSRSGCGRRPAREPMRTFRRRSRHAAARLPVAVNLRLERRRAGRSVTALAAGRGGEGLTVQGLSIVKPPYGVLAAIDLEQGAVKWQVPHGDTPDNVRNHPLLKGLNDPAHRQSGSVGLVITKTLVILGDPQVTTTQNGRGAPCSAPTTRTTGKEVGAVFMPAPQSGSPMTYMLNGSQYIVVAVSGGPYTGEYLAFSLPPDAIEK